MFVYFDENGTLKEIITEKSFRVGDSKRDKIYVYWEGEHAPSSGWVKYRKPNGHEYPESVEECFFQLGDKLVAKQLPTKPLRNLKYFSYDHTYEENGEQKIGYLFYEITLPDEILNSSMDDEEVPSENNMVIARIRFVLNEGEHDSLDDFDTIATMGALVFSVETNIGILTDSSINETQYNYFIKLISAKIGLGVSSVKVNALPAVGNGNVIYYVKTENSDFIYDAYFWNGDNFVYLGTTSYGLYTKQEGDEFEIAIQALWTAEMTDYEALINGEWLSYKTNLDNDWSNYQEQINSIVQAAKSGSPKGVYATSSSLSNANPDHNYIYIVLEDLKWYYWNSSTSSWTAGGTYLTAAYDTELSVSSDNAVQNKVVSKIAQKVSTSIYKKVYTIYSWFTELGPHFNQYCVGHMTSYSGYTTCDYVCVSIGDELTLSMLEGITQIRISKYSIGSDGKITSYDGFDTYTETTTITFTKTMLIRISVRGSTNPSVSLCKSSTTLKSFRSKEDIFVYPYGPWEYPIQYINTNATGITETLPVGLNGDPYWDTVAKGARIISDNSVLASRPGVYSISVNANYSYIKYGIQEPSLLQTAFWKKNNLVNFKLGLLSAVDGHILTTSFYSMSDRYFATLLNLILSYNGDPSGFATTEQFLLFFEMQKPTSNQTIFSTKEEADDLFNSFVYETGFRYKGEKIDLSVKETKNGLLYTYKGRFPFISNQTGGQKPSCMSEYNGKLFVGCDDYGCNIVNLSDMSLVATIADNSLEHFNNSEFTDEFYDESDDYPLLLVGNANRAYNNDLGDEWSDYIKYVRFANDLSSFSVVKKLIVPISEAGFWSNGIALDKETKTLWILGYKTQNWSSATDNYLILTSWDLTKMTQDNYGNYIPTLKTRCALPYVRALQDAVFCNGYIFSLADSDDAGEIPSQLYIIDTKKQTIRRTIIDYMTPFAEIESITKIFDEENQKYYLLIGEALYNQYGGVNGTYGHVYRLDTID